MRDQGLGGAAITVTVLDEIASSDALCAIYRVTEGSGDHLFKEGLAREVSRRFRCTSYPFLASYLDPEEAQFPDMPRNAAEDVSIDYPISVADMPALLTRLAVEGCEPEEWNGEQEMEKRPTELSCP